MSVKLQIEALREELRQHNYNYYVLDNPVISDYDFDMKLKELQQLESTHQSFMMKTRQPFVWVVRSLKTLKQWCISIVCTP